MATYYLKIRRSQANFIPKSVIDGFLEGKLKTYIDH